MKRDALGNIIAAALYFVMNFTGFGGKVKETISPENLIRQIKYYVYEQKKGIGGIGSHNSYSSNLSLLELLAISPNLEIDAVYEDGIFKIYEDKWHMPNYRGSNPETRNLEDWLMPVKQFAEENPEQLYFLAFDLKPYGDDFTAEELNRYIHDFFGDILYTPIDYKNNETPKGIMVVEMESYSGGKSVGIKSKFLDDIPFEDQKIFISYNPDTDDNSIKHKTYVSSIALIDENDVEKAFSELADGRIVHVFNNYSRYADRFRMDNVFYFMDFPPNSTRYSIIG